MNNEWQHLVDEIQRLKGRLGETDAARLQGWHEVERLRAEINSRREDALDTEAKVERLRAALKPFANVTNGYDDALDPDDRPVGPFQLGFYRAARAALEDKPAHPCDNGCQYSKDVGMWPEHSCGNGCMYDKAALEDKP